MFGPFSIRVTPLASTCGLALSISPTMSITLHHWAMLQRLGRVGVQQQGWKLKRERKETPSKNKTKSPNPQTNYWKLKTSGPCSEDSAAWASHCQKGREEKQEIIAQPKIRHLSQTIPSEKAKTSWKARIPKQVSPGNHSSYKLRRPSWDMCP